MLPCPPYTFSRQGSIHTRLIEQEVRVHGEGCFHRAIFVDFRHDLLLATGDAVGTASWQMKQPSGVRLTCHSSISQCFTDF